MIPIIFMAIENETDRNKIISIYEKYHGLMLYITMQVLSDRALAEDAVSDTIEKLIHNTHKLGDVNCYKTRSFIVIIARNTAINILKKAKRTVSTDIGTLDIADNAPYVVDKILSLEGYKRIVDIINSLSDTYKDVASLALLHECSHKEIAEILDIRYDAVKMRLSRAKSLIRTQMAELDTAVPNAKVPNTKVPNAADPNAAEPNTTAEPNAKDLEQERR